MPIGIKMNGGLSSLENMKTKNQPPVLCHWIAV